MALNLKLPGLGGSKKSSAVDETIAAQTVMDSGGSKGKKGAALSFLNQYSVNKQLQILGGALLLAVGLLAALIIHDTRESNYGTAYVAASGEMRMLSQRLAKASSLALQGNPTAFKQLKDSRDRFSQLTGVLTNGGNVNEINVPPSPDDVRVNCRH